MDRRQFIKRSGAGVVAGAAASTGLAAPAIAQGAMQWRMQMTWAKNSPLLSTGAQIVADHITKASGGRLSVRLYAAGEIVPPFQVLDAVADGTLDMGHGYPAYWAGKHPAMQFFTPMPFGMTTQEQNAWLSYGGGLELADELYSQLGVKFFPSGNTSVQGSGWFNKELNSIADYQGLKVRSGGLAAKVLSEVGATPVQMPLGEVPQALQSGAIDGADFVGPMNDMAFGLHKVAKYYYWPGWMEPCGLIDCFVNMAKWDSLDDDLKEIIRGANWMANQIMLNEFVAKNAQALVQIKATEGVEVRTLSDETLSALAEAAKGVVENVATQDPLAQKVYDSIMTFSKMVRPYTVISEASYINVRPML
ncbi:TRAP transporter substrate-binding protein [Acuticoccus mangrovi]|uniref:TRAP transporter substrate-binding protein n=1 Tax=Acuticoccus mangrovi TaxID=2796142 RepID=A0A934MBR7_9HYPH|nr:TRAP transporter substrate-binding protein [Acuticoccus mangrovi]MBJ3774432.1 TRAP transporter substrate-binding protein [Acuticoccus mangrovi]